MTRKTFALAPIAAVLCPARCSKTASTGTVMENAITISVVALPSRHSTPEPAKPSSFWLAGPSR